MNLTVLSCVKFIHYKYFSGKDLIPVIFSFWKSIFLYVVVLFLCSGILVELM